MMNRHQMNKLDRIMTDYTNKFEHVRDFYIPTSFTKDHLINEMVSNYVLNSIAYNLSMMGNTR